MWKDSWFGAGCRFALDASACAVVGPRGERMSYDEWIDAVAPIRGRRGLERLLRAESGDVSFTAKPGRTLRYIRACRQRDAIVLCDVSAEECAGKRAVLCEVLRSTGGLCFDYDIEEDELVALAAGGERVIANFSKGKYGSLVRTVLASGADAGSVETCLGRVWYAVAPGEQEDRRKYVGAVIPSDIDRLRAARDLDKSGEVGYTGCDADQRRFERYRLLGEEMDAVTFDYDPAQDTLVYSVSPARGAHVESVVSGYLANMDMCDRIAPESREICRANMLRAMNAATSGSFEYRADFFGSGYRWYRLRYVSAADGEGRVHRVVGCADEIEKEMADRADLMKCARIDGVTGLYNRMTAQRLIERALTEVCAPRLDALFVIDIDDFKRINDTHGHLEGDVALLDVADAIRSVFREEDIKGRYGGDEFIVYMRSFTDPALPSAVARRLMNRLSADREDVSCSIGVALVRECTRFEDVFARADRALYRAKNASKSCFSMCAD